MYKHNNLNGMTFGRLTVIEESGRTKDRHILWKCQCECGNKVNVSSRDLLKGHTKSCGCLQKDVIKNIRYKHGDRDARLYTVWKSMKKRCENPNCKSYKWYGAKGVSVCGEWHDYNVFREWAYANGYDDSADFQKCTLDRIDNDGNYEPSNCRWVDRITQANNTSKNHHVELNGIRMTIAEFARAMNISKNHAWYYMDKFEREVMNGQQFDKTPGCD